MVVCSFALVYSSLTNEELSHVVRQLQDNGRRERMSIIKEQTSRITKHLAVVGLYVLTARSRV